MIGQGSDDNEPAQRQRQPSSSRLNEQEETDLYEELAHKLKPNKRGGNNFRQQQQEQQESSEEEQEQPTEKESQQNENSTADQTEATEDAVCVIIVFD